LRAIADGMTRETLPERLLAASLRPIARAASARVASLYLIDNVTGRLVCEAQCEGTDVDRGALPRDAGLTGTSLQSGAIVATDHPERDPRFDASVDTPESGGVGPLLVIPLRVRDRVLGVARVFPGAPGDASTRLAELIAAPLSAATRNVLLYRSLLESVEDVARARREADGRR
jgi:sigma-B regulation protein RsbU (phosphoserine phosphatase)